MSLLLPFGAAAQIATVYTDKPDYLPGDTVIIEGSGWQPGELVQLDIDHSHVTHGNTVLYAQANSIGDIYNNQFIIQPSHLGESFMLVAVGMSSGRIAQTTFTDGNAPGKVTVGTQNGTAVYGTPSSVTYLISVDRIQSQPTTNAGFTADLTISPLPAGVTATFTPVSVLFPNSGTQTATSTLTLTTTAAVNATATPISFTVTAKTGTVTAQASGTLSVARRTLTPVVTIADKEYDGNATATFAYASVNGLVNGDVVSLGGSAMYESSSVGINKTVTVTGLFISGPNVANYVLSTTFMVVPGRITIKALTVSGITVSNKIYDGTTDATLSSASLAGIVGSDQVSLVAGSVAFQDKHAGAAKTVTAFNLSLTGASVNNYTLATTSVTTTASILQKQVSVSGIAVSNKTYDRSTAAALTGTAVLNGVIAGDAVNLDATGATASFADKNAGSNKAVTVSGYSIAGADAPNYDLQQPSGLQAGIAPLSITGTVTVSDKQYDGNTTATVSGRYLAGVLGADAVSYSGGTAAFGNAAVGSGKLVTVTGLSLSGTDASNYTVNSTATATAGILPRQVTASFTAQNKTYDGTTNAGFTVLALTGVLPADAAALSVSGGPAAFSDKNAGTGKTVTLANLSLSGAAAGNYVLASTTATATANILVKTVSPSFTADAKPYDGTTAATIATRTLTGVIGGDDVALAGGTAVFSSKDAGAGKTVTGTGFSLSGADAGNYALSSTSATTTATIIQKELEAVFTAADKVYDGTTSASITSRSLIGVVGSENVGLSGGTAAFDTKDAGTGKTVTATGFTLSGPPGVVANYTLASNTATATASITGKMVTPVVTVANKVYDGTTSATISGTSLTGVQAGDVVTVTGGSAAFATKTVGTGKPVQVTGLSLSGTHAANYSLSTTTVSVTASITALAIAPSFTADDKVYDGTATATIGSRSLSGLIGGDNVSLAGGTAAFVNKDAGTGKTVNGGSFSLTGTDAPNYTLSPASVSTTASITPKPVTPVVSVASKVYDGNVNGTVSGRSLSGVVGADAVSLSGGDAAFADKNAGSGKAVTVTGFSLTGADAGNYSLSTATAAATASITPKDLAVTGVTANDKEYDKTRTATLSAGSAGLAGVVVPDQVTLLTNAYAATFADANAGAGKAVTVTGFALAGADAGNYTLTQPSGLTAEITRKPLTALVAANSKVYDGTTDATIRSQSLQGVISGDNVNLSISAAHFSDKNAGVGKVVTASGLSLGGPARNNYSVGATATALADITPLGITASFTAADKVYDGGTAASVLSRSLTGVLGTDDVTMTGGSAAFADKNAAAGKTVSLSGASLAGTDAGNYQLSAVSTATASITPRAIAVTPSPNQGKVYGAADPVLTYSVTAGTVVAGDAFSGALSRMPGEDVGAWAITPGSLTLGTNYNLSVVAGEVFTITERGITVAADAGQQKKFGEADPVLTYSIVSGSLAGTDSFSGALARAAGEDVGKKLISLGTLSLGSNYSLTFVGGAEFTIVPADPSVVVVAVPNPVQYSDLTTLTATITSAIANVQSEINRTGGTVKFYHTAVAPHNLLGQESSSSCPLGVISKEIRINLPESAGNSLAVFAQFEPASQNLNAATSPANYTLEILREDAHVAYSGLQYFTTESSTSNVAKNINFRATFVDTTDGAHGTIMRAAARFSSSSASFSNVSVNQISAGDTIVGESWTANQTILLSQSEMNAGGTSFEINVEAEGRYYKGSEGPTLITIAVPGRDFINGGGHVLAQNPSGTYACQLNSKINFGFTMKWNKSGKNVMGQCNIIFRRMVNGTMRIYQIKSNSINSLGTATVNDGRRADFSTKATLTDITNPKSPVSLGGNLDLSVQALESTDPLVPNQISITLRSSGGDVLFCSNWVSGRPAMKGLGGGNIKVLNTTSVGSATARTATPAAPGADAEIFENYPNPFTGSTTLRFTVEADQQFELDVYDIRGALVRRIDAGTGKAGQVHEYELDGKLLREGVYVVRLTTQQGVRILKIVKKQN